MIYFQALYQRLAGEISANHENVCVMNPLSETRLEKRISRCWSRNSNHFTEMLDVNMEMNGRTRVHWYILLRHMCGSNALLLYSHVITTKHFRMRWYHNQLINMKVFGQVITQLAVSYVRFWNGVYNNEVLWNMTKCRLVNIYRNLTNAYRFHLQGLGNTKL